MKYKWLLFDADNTLLDYNKSEKKAFAESCNYYNILVTPILTERYQQINKYLWSEFEKGNITSKKLRIRRFRFLFEDFNIKIKPKDFSNRYLDKLSRTSFLIDGALEILNSLKEKTELAIITNGIKFVQNGRLKASKLDSYFKEIIISEDVGTAKPDKIFFDYTLNKINFTTKNEILIIGDSLSSDIKGGINAGIDTCWFNPNQNGNITSIKPTYEINNLNDIIKIIGI